MPVTNTTVWAATGVILLSFGRDDGATIAGIAVLLCLGRGLWRAYAQRRQSK